MEHDEIKSIMGKAYKKYVCHRRNRVKPLGLTPEQRMGFELCPTLSVMKVEKKAKERK